MRNIDLVNTVIKSSGEINPDKKFVENIVNSTFKVIATELQKEGKLLVQVLEPSKFLKEKQGMVVTQEHESLSKLRKKNQLNSNLLKT